MRRRYELELMVALLAAVGGCAGSQSSDSGLRVVSSDPSRPGAVTGVGVEAHDIVSMSDLMMRDMLAEPRLVKSGAGKAPRVIIDSQYFVNDSSQAINKNLITDRLRVSLNRSAKGAMAFVGRTYARAVEDERDLKRAGKTDVGTAGLTKGTLGADFRLGGRIASLDQRSSTSGAVQRYTQITFEMFDLETSEIVWSGIYEFQRSAVDDAVYR